MNKLIHGKACMLCKEDWIGHSILIFERQLVKHPFIDDNLVYLEYRANDNDK